MHTYHPGLAMDNLSLPQSSLDTIDSKTSDDISRELPFSDDVANGNHTNPGWRNFRRNSLIYTGHNLKPIPKPILMTSQKNSAKSNGNKKRARLKKVYFKVCLFLYSHRRFEKDKPMI